MDASGSLADGCGFTDIDGLRTLLAADPDTLARGFVKQLLMYATGTDIHYTDRREIDRIVAAAQDRGYGIRTIIHLVADSDLFRGT